MPEAGRHPRNPALWVGLILFGLVVLVALIGPSLVPGDPLQENYIGQLASGRFIKPPFPPGAVEGFPLGSDEWGRDLFSRLLWGIRPTLMMVVVVAAVRLMLGALVGLISGWSSSSAARLLDSVISAGLAVPALFVALVVIAALGNRWGVWAFILGLTLTGWAESARVVREQTRLVRSQPFIEAARSLGASPAQQILDHVLPQVMPLLWIQLAFEVSSTLLGMAALGFLGYYVNAVWIPVGDFVGLRTTGTPELAQMLGVSVSGKQPWSAVFAGGVLVILVLAANLIGEGLRMELNPERRRARAGVVTGDEWLSQSLYRAASQERVEKVLRLAPLVILFLAIGGGFFIWQAQNRPQGTPQVEVPGGHWWAAQAHDAQGTRWSPVMGANSAEVLWQVSLDASITGSPAVDVVGNIYVTFLPAEVLSMDLQGKERWRLHLPAQPVGAPALTPEGRVLVTDTEGALTAISADGRVIWRVNHQQNQTAALSGAVVASDGTAYYPTRSSLLAVDSQGNLRWRINLPTYSIINPLPRLSRREDFLFFQKFVLDARTGETLFSETPGPMDFYLVGADGRSYLYSTEGMLEWIPTEGGATLVKRSTLDPRALLLNFRRIADAGVSPGGNVWMWFGSQYEKPRFVWSDPRGQSPAIFSPPWDFSILIGLDQGGRAYLCGSQWREQKAECVSVGVQSGAVEWRLTMPGQVVGGAILPGKLILTTDTGDILVTGAH